MGKKEKESETEKEGWLVGGWLVGFMFYQHF